MLTVTLKRAVHLSDYLMAETVAKSKLPKEICPSDIPDSLRLISYHCLINCR